MARHTWQPWMFMVVGPVAAVAAIYLLTTDIGSEGAYAMIDWSVIGIGILLTHRGYRMYRANRRGTSVLQAHRSRRRTARARA